MTRLIHHFSYFTSFSVISTDDSLDFTTFLHSLSNEVLFSKCQLPPAICRASSGFSSPVGTCGLEKPLLAGYQSS